MKASEYYKAKPVNVVNQVWHKDGTVTVRIYKEGWKKAYQFKVKKLNEPDEEIIEDENVIIEDENVIIEHENVIIEHENVIIEDENVI